MIGAVGIVAKPDQERMGAEIPQLVAWLRRRSLGVFCDAFAAEFAGPGVPGLDREDLMARIDLLVVLGGDGTLLSAAHAASERDVPILAVNFGHLGFLTTVAFEELHDTLVKVLDGKCETWTHMMLEAEVRRDGQPTEVRRGLNDVVLTKGLPSHMIDYELLVDDALVCSFRADGLIFSTPTGSTAYSLSAGGPIVYAQIEAFIVTPVCPHMLSHRPLVLPAAVRLAARFTGGDEPAYLTVDGAIAAELRHGDRVEVRKSKKSLRLVRPPQRTYFEVLRDKLRWGEQ